MSGQRRTFITTIIICSILLVLTLSFSIYLTGKYWQYFLIGLIILAFYESWSNRKETGGQLKLYELLLASATSLTTSFTIAYLLIIAMTRLMPDPSSFGIFIILNVIVIFISDFAHSFITEEIIKLMLRTGYEGDYAQSIILARNIHPSIQASVSGIRSAISTAVLLLLLAVIMTYGITSVLLPKIDQSLQGKEIEIPPINAQEEILQLTVLKDLDAKRTEYNELLASERSKLEAAREKVTGNIMTDTITLLKGDLIPVVSTTQS